MNMKFPTRSWGGLGTAWIRRDWNHFREPISFSPGSLEFGASVENFTIIWRFRCLRWLRWGRWGQSTLTPSQSPRFNYWIHLQCLSSLSVCFIYLLLVTTSPHGITRHGPMVHQILPFPPVPLFYLHLHLNQASILASHSNLFLISMPLPLLFPWLEIAAYSAIPHSIFIRPVIPVVSFCPNASICLPTLDDNSQSQSQSCWSLTVSPNQTIVSSRYSFTIKSQLAQMQVIYREISHITPANRGKIRNNNPQSQHRGFVHPLAHMPKSHLTCRTPPNHAKDSEAKGCEGVGRAAVYSVHTLYVCR